MQPGNRSGAALGGEAALREGLECFSYDGYRQLLERLRSSHAFCGFAEGLPEDGCFVLLRHDIDLSLEAAAEMAEFEAAEGVRSTYFVLFSSPFYNPLEPGAERALRRIVRARHEIGLHYDAGLMETQAASGSVEEIAKVQAALLSKMTGVEVCCIAMHNPSLFSGGDPLAKSTAFVNAYTRTHQNKISYYSDSCGAWRTAALDALTGAELPRRLHLLTHPELWSTAGGSRWDRLETRLARRRQAFNEAVAYMLEVYNEHPAVKEHDARRMRRT